MTINELIKSRRAVFPPQYDPDRKIPKGVIAQILENANWAPTHRRTEPWRFKVYTGAPKNDLGGFLAKWYKDNTPEDLFSQRKYEKTLMKVERTACIIAICMQRDQEERVPEWEEIAAVACAVQNMWLTCTALEIGSYWSTPKSINDFGEFEQLAEGEKCIGFFYMGHIAHAVPEGSRQAIEDKVKWFE